MTVDTAVDGRTRGAEVILRATGLRKTFGATQALKGVDVELRRGEVHALLGSNGAGKSTFIKILDGIYRADAGTIETFGNVAFIHQDLGLVPDLTVVENLAISEQSGMLIRQREEREHARSVLKLIDLDLDIDTMMRDVPLGVRTLIAIGRALSKDADLIVLDEATAGLTENESRWLFAHVREFAARGASVLVVSHRLQEIVENCDRTTFFRDGSIVFAGDTPAVGDLHALFSATELKGETFAGRDAVAEDAPVAVELVSCSTSSLGPIDLAIRAGEVVSVVGSITSGLYELAHLVADRVTPDSGQIHRAGNQRIGFVPEDRWEQGLLPDQEVTTNLTVAAPERFSARGVWRMAAERQYADDFVDQFHLSPARTDLIASSFSGGNAQKILMGRSVANDPGLVVLAEPTRGVDVATRHVIYTFVNRLRSEGVAVLVVTLDVNDALATADRILVMKNGRLSSSVFSARTEPSTLLEAIA